MKAMKCGHFCGHFHTDVRTTRQKHISAPKSASMTALQASYVVACAVLERYCADVCSSNDREVQDRDGQRPAQPSPLSRAASSLWRSSPSSSSAGTAESLPVGCWARAMSSACATSNACTISMPKPAPSEKNTANLGIHVWTTA